MEICASNKLEVMKYLKNQFLVRLSWLSKKITTLVVNFLKNQPIKTYKSKSEFTNFVEKEGIVILPEYILSNSRYDFRICWISKTEHERIDSFFRSIGTFENDCLIVKNFISVDCSILELLNYKIHFEEAKYVVFRKNPKGLVTIGSVKKVEFEFIPEKPLPIKNAKSVEEVSFTIIGKYSGAFLDQFTKLKVLIKERKKFSSFCTTKLHLPFLEYLEVFGEQVIIDSVSLRELKYEKTSIDYAGTCFILKQSRLIFLVLKVVNVSSFIKFPLTCKFLIFEFN